MDISGKVAIITGASSGIGEATAELLGHEGVRVVIAARRKEKLDSLAKRIIDAGGKALVVETDVTDKSQAKGLVEKAVSEYGQLDIVVNNAGVMLLGPAMDAPLEEWERMIHLNLLGLLYVTHAALPHLKNNGSGDIVNISSVAGRMPRSGSAVYNMTKFGVGAFTEALRQELSGGKTGIRTTLIEPGAVATELADHLRDEVKEQMMDRFKDITRLESEDIANAILYAVSQPEHVSVNEMLIRPSQQAG